MGAGFQYADLQTLYLNQQNARDDALRWSDKATSFIDTVRLLVDIDNPQSESQKDTVNIVWKSLMASESTEGERKIWDIVRTRLLDPKTTEDKLVKKRLDDIMAGLTRPYMVTDELLHIPVRESNTTQEGNQ